MSDRVAADAFPPGEYLQDELDARGWTQAEFAEIIGRPVRLVNEIIGGKRGITPETAQEIGAALGTSALFWLNLDAAYQLRTEKPVSPNIALRAKLRDRFPVREMIKSGWIEASTNPEVLETQLLAFYHISRIDEPPRLAHAAKRTTAVGYPDGLSGVQLAWLFRVNQIAEGMPSVAYSESALRKALPALRELMGAPDGVEQVPRILAACGVRFVIVEPVPGSKIDGVCFWLARKAAAPVIGMSLRLDKIDNFWFVLRHEIEHVLRGHGRDEAIVDSDSEGPPGESQEEQVANQAGGTFGVSDADMSDFILRVRPIFSEQNVINFAARMRVHPGIVVGQIQRRTGRYDLLRKYLVKVRQLVVPVAMTDGYGQVLPVKS
jgi:HTH-type transcriptional regulator/antitoxin HigA